MADSSRKIQAVFWDYDNTILATAEAHWKKHEIVLARHGILLPPLFQQRIYENNGSQNWEWISRELGLTIVEKDYLEAIDFEFQKYVPQLNLRPGVIELFEILQRCAIPQAIVTNARRGSAEPVLLQKKIPSFMQFILYKEDYEGRKPSPLPYLRGFEKMEGILNTSIDPERCLVIEDDPKGVQSAHAAGAIVIHRKLSIQDEDSPFAHYCCFEKDDFIKVVTQLIS